MIRFSGQAEFTDFTLTASELNIQIQGPGPGQFDVLDIVGSVNLVGAAIDIIFESGFAPKTGDVFDILTTKSSGLVTNGASDGAIDILSTSFNLLGLDAGFLFDISVVNILPGALGTSGGSNVLRLTALNDAVNTPEPANLLFFGLAGLGIAARRRRSRSTA